MPATIDDTYAEAFRSIYAAVLITARDRYWLDQRRQAATGNASSTILCDCEAGLDRYVDADATPGPPTWGGRAVPCPAVLQGPRSASRTLAAGPRLAERADLPDHGRVQRAAERVRSGSRSAASWPTSATATSTRPSGSADGVGWCRSCRASS